MLWWGLWSQDASLGGCCWELPPSLSCFPPANSSPPLLTFPTELAGNWLFRMSLAWRLAGIMSNFLIWSFESFVIMQRLPMPGFGMVVVGFNSISWLGLGETPPVSRELHHEMVPLLPSSSTDPYPFCQVISGLRPSHWGSMRRGWSIHVPGLFQLFLPRCSLCSAQWQGP